MYTLEKIVFVSILSILIFSNSTQINKNKKSSWLAGNFPFFNSWLYVLSAPGWVTVEWAGECDDVKSPQIWEKCNKTQRQIRPKIPLIWHERSNIRRTGHWLTFGNIRRGSCDSEPRGYVTIDSYTLLQWLLWLLRMSPRSRLGECATRFKLKHFTAASYLVDAHIFWRVSSAILFAG